MVEQSTRSTGSQVVIEVWADLGCPWCYVGKHRLQAAISQRPDADRFKIMMRSFELDPEAPQELEKNEESFIRTHGGTAAHVLQAERQMQAMARKEGLEYSLDRLNANTFGLHRVVQYANDQGRGFEFFSDAQDGFFAGTLNPYDADALAGVAESVGLDGPRDPHEQRVRRPCARRPPRGCGVGRDRRSVRRPRPPGRRPRRAEGRRLCPVAGAGGRARAE
ncbi:hypothetical protein GCM10009802_08760 [Streptomyces synnematoformans]|uniref:DSBA-like thioredoxin domain-containing protein n=1 Tax=Streptomyces synnematoformans TaxID=415721 RepID=A0ABN2XH37_9ACTN